MRMDVGIGLPPGADSIKGSQELWWTDQWCRVRLGRHNQAWGFGLVVDRQGGIVVHIKSRREPLGLVAATDSRRSQVAESRLEG